MLRYNFYYDSRRFSNGDDGGSISCRMRRTLRSAARHVSTIATSLLLFAATFIHSPALYAGNVKDYGTLTATWNAQLRRIDIRQTLADYDGADSWYHGFSLMVNDKEVLRGTEPSNAHDGDDYQKYTLTAYDTDNGTVVVGYLGSDKSTKYWTVNPSNDTKTFYVANSGSGKDYIDMWVEYYPSDDMLGRSITVKTDCYRSSTTDNDIRTASVSVTNPLSDVSLENVQYGSKPEFTFTVKRPTYDATYDWNTNGNIKMYVEEFYLNGSKYYEKALDVSASSSFTGTYGTIANADIIDGREIRIRYEKEYDSNLSLKQKTKYTKYSNKVQILPVKLPVSPTIEDNGCGQLKVTWNTEGGSQSSQAGNVIIYNSSNTKLGTVAYDAKQWLYNIPTTDIGGSNKTYTFKITREPFNASSQSNTVKTISFTKNMNYRQMSNFSITPQGGKSFSLSWGNDNGYYCSDYKYRVKIEQGANTYTSPLIDITSTSAEINASSATFDFCSPTTIKLEMLDGGTPVVSKTVTNSYVFIQTSNDSQITSFVTSKGFYSSRVQLDWTVSPSNQFAKYLVYRKEYGSTTAGKGTLIANIDHSNGVNQYSIDDNNAVPGKFYNYSVEGQMDCGSNVISTIADKSNIGYIQPFGTVSGRITYSGSESVAGVTVRAEGNSEAKNKALDFSAQQKTYIQTPYKDNMLSTSAFTFQAWVMVRSENDADHQSLMDAAGKYAVEVDGANVWLSVYKGNDTQYDEYAFTGVPFQRATYKHISITYQKTGAVGSAVLYLDGMPVDTVENAGIGNYAFPTASAADSEIYFGRYFEAENYLNGYMDELRLWNRALTATEIAQNYNSYLSGKETGLKLYYRFDELDNMGDVFDISGSNNDFNQNHGTIYGAIMRSSETNATPSPEQLSIKTVTDANGNYLINTIPYTGDGNVYNIVPAMGEHSFNPDNSPIFFSSSSTTHNNINFTDVSSFAVRGRVVYEGGNYPVKDCSFEIDGKTVVMPNGTVVQSDADGAFEISVPIGSHTVRVVKTGHTFANDGYLKDAEGVNLIYNAPVAGVLFEDQTKIKLIGRVVGGNAEADKPLGFGESKNNIGVETVVLNSTMQQYNFVSTPVSQTYSHNDGQWRKPDGLSDDETVVDYNQKNITVHVSPTTGEFVAMVYPESYEIQSISVTQGGGNPVLIVKDETENIDLSNNAVPDASYLQSETRTWADSTFISGRPGVVDHWEYGEQSDTIRYAAKWTHKYQATPTFGVKQVQNGVQVDYFGEKTFTLKDEIAGITETIDLYNEASQTYLFGKPVFQQGTKYAFRFNAYEEYTNYISDPAVTVRYPISNGAVNLTNNLQVTPQPETLAMDSAGILNYEFTAGAPNLTTASSDIFATLTLGAVSYYWDMGNTPLEAWQLGEKSTGTNFMTAGPDQLTAILRDPPGTASSAYIESGTSITSTTTVSAGATLSEELNITSKFGLHVETFVGVGAGVVTSVESKANLATNLSSEQSYSYENETSVTTTFTERFSTSDSPEYVGAAGDVFIGNSTNILYGLTNGVQIKKGVIEGTPWATSGDYKLAPSSAIAYGQDFATRFAFTAMELENIMIPKWKNSIVNRLLPVGSMVNTASISSPVYVSKLAEIDENFGKWNLDNTFKTDPAFNRLKPFDGASYKIYFPDAWTAASEEMTNFQDSILWANNQINMWEEVLAQNEEEKVKMVHSGNYSFGGGASIEYSASNTDSWSYSHSWGFTITPEIGVSTGADVNGVGLEIEVKAALAAETSGSTGKSGESTISTGFTLAEDGTSDEISVDYGKTASGTFAFKTRGGQTSCPYEGEVVTQYYQPGQHILQEATMQIEAPKIEVASAAQVLNVPANRTASFTLSLQNESETGDDVYFQLVVDEETNPDGAELKIDGIGIGNGRTFLVRAGQTLTKTLTLGKGAVDDYDNIGIILQSLCDEIADTAWVTAHFVPACSDVMLSQPANNFIANTETGDILSITLQNFDVNFPNFGYIRLEQRIAGSPSWTTLRTFYPTNLFNSPTNTDGTKEDIGDRAAIVYDWNMASRADGQYELRATTASVNISNNEIVDSPLSTYSTEAITGYKDMVKPQALGAPSPANGIYGASDELSITFNEEINTAMVISDNIAVTYGASATPVPVTFVASANKITLEYPSDYFSILEDQTLDITVSDIYDMHGNKSEPISWQAYVNRNALVWETDEINLVKEAGATLTFTAKIKNAGANTVSYSFVNLPQWLSVNQPTGNLQPLAVKELTFSISSGVNLGAYNEQIGLTSGNGIVKKLPLNLAVTGALPEGWTVNPADYERTMTVTGRLQIGGIYQTDEADMLAAFIGDECLGITSPIKPQAAIDGYYTFLTVYGNSAHEGQPVKFKLWDASTGNIYSAIESTLSGVAQNITFAADAMKGSVSVPLIHNAQDIVEQSIVLNNGWSWISVNVLNSNPNIFSQFVERIGENGVQLKSKNGYAEAPDWIGTLSSIEKEQMYLVQTDAATTLKFDGTPAAPASSPITLANGWNWLGYIPQFTLPVNEALSNLTAQANDQIKGQKAYRSFANAEIGWVGTLNYLRTGEGYMYYSGAGGSTSFNYPGAGSQIYRAASRASEAAADNHWTVNVHAYPNSMTMTSVMIKNGVELQSDQMEIAAFDANSECRGSIRLNNYPQEAAHPYLAFLMIYGEESVPLTFKAYDHATETEYAVTNTENFVINNRYGNSREPYEFILYAPTGIDESGIEQIAVYPNPATEILNIAYPFNSIEKLEITDLSGRIIRSERNFSANKINVTSLVEGLYLLKVTHDGETVVKKFAVKY